MFKLMRREIEDNIFYFVLAICIAIALVLIVGMSVWDDLKGYPSIGIPVMMYMPFYTFMMLGGFIAAALGVSQMYGDRSKRISSFLVTLATTRMQIITVRIAGGVLWTLIILLPVLLVWAVMNIVFKPMLMIDAGGFMIMLAAVFMLYLCCYSSGLLMGWSSSKIVRPFAAVLLSTVPLNIIMVKGFSWSAVLILLIYFIAAIVVVVLRYLRAAL